MTNIAVLRRKQYQVAMTLSLAITLEIITAQKFLGYAHLLLPVGAYHLSSTKHVFTT